MSKQIFKKKIPNDFFFKMLESICSKNDNYFIFTIESFKKGIFKEIIQQFIIDCNEYYHISKRKYLENTLCYNSFTTILRQICNFNQITFTSKIKYNKSLHYIEYFIYFNLESHIQN